MRHLLTTYYHLAKPGLIYGNAVMALGGFLLASYQQLDVGLGVAMITGICLVMASGLVFNNYLDRHLDAQMVRTKRRALVTGEVPVWAALTYGTGLGILGIAVLWVFTNLLTTMLALVGWVFYVAVYGYLKRRSVHGTLVGGVAGAVPPVVGYCAVTGALDATAFLLFASLFCWQMTHSYAIALFRQVDYTAAGLPVLPVVHGATAAKQQTLAYMIAFTCIAVLLAFPAGLGYIYVVLMVGVGGWVCWQALQTWRQLADTAWAYQVFKQSLVALLVFAILISVGSYLP